MLPWHRFVDCSYISSLDKICYLPNDNNDSDCWFSAVFWWPELAWWAQQDRHACLAKWSIVLNISAHMKQKQDRKKRDPSGLCCNHISCGPSKEPQRLHTLLNLQKFNHLIQDQRQKHFNGTQQQLKIRSIVALFCISGWWNWKEEDAIISWMLSRTLRLRLYL